MKRLYCLLISMFFVFSTSAPVIAQMYGGQGWGWHDSGWGWGHMVFGGLMMIVFWGGLILVIALIVKWLIGPGRPESHLPPSHHTALQILHERFARGEIDKDEYEERKRLISR
jgi:putative membrane protein